MKQKNQIISLDIPKMIDEDDETDDESKEPNEFVEAIFRKHAEIKKKATKYYINEYIRNNIIKKNN